MELKTCTGCRQEYPATHEHFSIDNRRRDKLSIYCLTCKRQKNKIAEATLPYKRRKQARRIRARLYVLEWYKLKGGCPCGETNPACLQADHLDGHIKSCHISTMCGKGLNPETIQKELDKCQVLCANCHMKKTAKDFHWYKELSEGELLHDQA
jgi:hypothetical protein